MGNKKLSKLSINNVKMNNEAGLSINKNIIDELFVIDTNYRIIVFEGTMDLNQSSFSISRQINLTQGGTGLHTIQTYENKEKASFAYPKILEQAINESKYYYAGLIKSRYPNSTIAEQENLIPNFKITAMAMALRNNEYALQGYITTNYSKGKINIEESVINPKIPYYNQSMQK